MKKSIFRWVALAIQPVAYPAAAVYHAIVGSAITWICRGLPSTYSISALGWSMLASVAVGAALVVVSSNFKHEVE
ncbi:hypothetical protein [Hymenobacter metallicola]|uniref:Uncharacterized protein n=1 Tax=Hymenobacter metallicola TaxID=2563114 RepID=A0A4Z0Q1F1_9BACT|nr:hypothetical protein [Hymenobacter metallicola]TGE23515.1 hypothetical protein E5K02_20220 [Hymenobacter metallicola]